METQGMKIEISSDHVESGEAMDTSESGVNTADGVHMMAAGDIDFSGIQLQESIDQLAVTNQAGGGDVTHAMITADGEAVAVTLDPETGQYVTADGQTFMVQEANQGAAQQVTKPEVITSDLSSLAEAAEHHVMVDMGGESNTAKFQVPTVGQLPPESVLSTTEPSMISTTDTITAASGYSQDPYAFDTGRSVKEVRKDSSFRVINSDGGLVDLQPPPPQQSFRIVGQDGNVIQDEQQVLRIVNSEGALSNQHIRRPSPQIKVLNADGTLSPYSGGNIRVVQQEQQPKVRVVQTGNPGSPVKTTMTLAQAQQLGIVPQGSGNVKILPKSPTKTVRMADGRTVIVQSPQKQHQIVVKGNGPRYIQPNTGGAAISGQQQIIRIPGASNVGAGTIKKIQIGNTVQYVRVISSNQVIDKQKVNSQASVTVKGVQPILPSNVKAAEGSKVVKIQVPSGYNHTASRSTATPRSILPNAQGSSIFPEVEDESSEMEVQDEADEIEYKVNVKSNNSKQNSSNVAAFEASGVRPRKPCNCTKSLCLKLYCDCFANGEFCNNCNCTNCFNNIKFEKQRQKSIKQCLGRNPAAFKPKIGRLATDGGERRHNRGCNCKRSGCLKNYCECYEAKIPCTENCRCIGCKNVDEDISTNPDAKPGEKNSSSAVRMLLAAHRRNEIRPSLKAKLAPLNSLQPTDGKQPFSFVTSDVVEATCQCLLAQAEEAEAKNQSQEDAESMIIDEFGRCLKQIIDMANKAAAAATIKAELG